MPLSKSDFEELLVSRQIFYFSCPEALNTNEPHYFVCICKHPSDIVILSCCTSQFQTVKALIERKRFPNETLVYVASTDIENDFKKDTYINCNEYFEYTIDELWIMYQNGEIVIKKQLPVHSFEQVLIGFRTSPRIEEDLKEALPSVDDI